MIELEIPGDSNDGGPNKRMHWQAKRRVNEQWRGKAHLIAESALRSGVAEPPKCRVRISFVVRRGRLLDPDNAASSFCLKALVDGLRDAGLLKDDTSRYCERGPVTQQVGKEFRNSPSVIVRIEELP